MRLAVQLGCGLSRLHYDGSPVPRIHRGAELRELATGELLLLAGPLTFRYVRDSAQTERVERSHARGSTRRLLVRRRVLLDTAAAASVWVHFRCFRPRLLLGDLIVYVEAVPTAESIREVAWRAEDMNDADDFDNIRGHEAFRGGAIFGALELLESGLVSNDASTQRLAARALCDLAIHISIHPCFRLPSREALFRTLQAAESVAPLIGDHEVDASLRLAFHRFDYRTKYAATVFPHI